MSYISLTLRFSRGEYKYVYSSYTIHIYPQKIESKLPLCYWNSTSNDLGVTYLNMAYT